MSENTLIWLFGVIGGWLVVLTSGMFFLFMATSKMRAALVTVSKRAADILHSPDDHMHLDDLLEKFQQDQLNEQDVQEFANRLVEIESDSSFTAGTRLLCTLVLLGIEHNPKYANLNLGDRITRHKPRQNHR